MLSFDPTGRERFIEVKTTAFGAATPFYVSRNEVAFSEERAKQFVLAPVHEFRTVSKVFELRGAWGGLLPRSEAWIRKSKRRRRLKSCNTSGCSAVTSVLLDSDLAALYGVPTRTLNQAVRRNIGRLPTDFLLQVTEEGEKSLRSQFVILKNRRGVHRKYASLAYTEHGAIMAATILNSPRAMQMSVYVVRAFVELRCAIASSAAVTRRLDALERTVFTLDADTRRQFDAVYEASFGLMGGGRRQ